jgi:nucleoside-diphosphate-sugar epimerase
VGIGGRVSLNQVIELLGKISGNRLEAKYDPPREGDIRDSQADITQARELLGYEPQVNFEEGLRRTFEWYRTSKANVPAKEAAPAPAK